MLRYPFSRKKAQKHPAAAIQESPALEKLAQCLQPVLQTRVMAYQLQVRCAIRQGTLFVLTEHLLHVEPDPQQTFAQIEAIVRENVTEQIQDPLFSPHDHKNLPVRLFLRIAGHQQPYEFHTFSVSLIPIADPQAVKVKPEAIEFAASLAGEPVEAPVEADFTQVEAVEPGAIEPAPTNSVDVERPEVEQVESESIESVEADSFEAAPADPVAIAATESSLADVEPEATEEAVASIVSTEADFNEDKLDGSEAIELAQVEAADATAETIALQLLEETIAIESDSVEPANTVAADQSIAIDSIEPGTDFPSIIQEQDADTEVFLEEIDAEQEADLEIDRAFEPLENEVDQETDSADNSEIDRIDSTDEAIAAIEETSGAIAAATELSSAEVEEATETGTAATEVAVESVDESENSNVIQTAFSLSESAETLESNRSSLAEFVSAPFTEPASEPASEPISESARESIAEPPASEPLPASKPLWKSAPEPDLEPTLILEPADSLIDPALESGLEPGSDSNLPFAVETVPVEWSNGPAVDEMTEAELQELEQSAALPDQVSQISEAVWLEPALTEPIAEDVASEEIAESVSSQSSQSERPERSEQPEQPSQLELLETEVFERNELTENTIEPIEPIEQENFEQAIGAENDNQFAAISPECFTEPVSESIANPAIESFPDLFIEQSNQQFAEPFTQTVETISDSPVDDAEIEEAVALQADTSAAIESGIALPQGLQEEIHREEFYQEEIDQEDSAQNLTDDVAKEHIADDADDADNNRENPIPIQAIGLAASLKQFAATSPAGNPAPAGDPTTAAPAPVETELTTKGLSFAEVLELEAWSDRQSLLRRMSLSAKIFAGTAGVFAIVAGAYALTRPCVLGDCPPVQQAQEMSDRAINTIQTTDSALAIVDAYDRLREVNGLLSPIPFWSPYYGKAQEIMTASEARASRVAQIVNALQKANEAAQKSQNPPHPMPRWREVQWLWRDAIAMLQKIPADSPVYALAQQRLKEYEASLAIINQRVAIEQNAQDRVSAARKTAEVAEAQAGIAKTAQDWQQSYAAWQAAVQALDQIPQGTMAHGEAEQLLALYQPRLQEANQRQGQESIAENAFRQANQLAEQARSLEQLNEWSEAKTVWQQAVANLQRIPQTTGYYSKAQSTIQSYQAAMTQAGKNAARLTAMRSVQPSLDLACAGAVPFCTYSFTPQAIRVQITRSYDQATERVMTTAQGNAATQAVLTNQVSNLLRSLAAISETAQVPIELYNANGSRFGTYSPEASGFVAQ